MQSIVAPASLRQAQGRFCPAVAGASRPRSREADARHFAVKSANDAVLPMYILNVHRAPTWAKATSSASDGCSTWAVSIGARAMSRFSSYAVPAVTFLFTTRVQLFLAGMG